jgi:hypothetical protein
MKVNVVSDKYGQIVKKVKCYNSSFGVWTFSVPLKSSKHKGDLYVELCFRKVME